MKISKKYKSKYYMAKVNFCIKHYYCENSCFKFLQNKKRINDFNKFNTLRKKNIPN